MVERLVYTENVGGSKPSPPTSKYFLLIHIQNLDVYLHPYILYSLIGAYSLGMRVKNHQSKKSSPWSISLVLGLLFTLLQIPQAYADQCLAQFPDSAWSKGEPQEVKALLNRDLMLAKVVAERTTDGKNLRITDPTLGIDQYAFVNEYLNNSYTEYIWKSGFVPTTYSVAITYQYEGVKCSTRIIRIQGGSITYKPYFEFDSMDSVKIKESLYRLTSKNGLEIERIVEAITNFGKYLDSTEKSPLKISQYEKYVNETNKIKTGASLETLVVTLQSDDNCVIDESPENIDFKKSYVDKLSTVEKNFYENNFNIRKNFLSTTKFNSNNPCKLKVSFLIKRSTVWNPPIAFPVVALKGQEPVRVNGYLWITNDLPTSKTKTTISCIRGKLIKKMSGVNPKCPAGYKLKK